MTKFVLEILDGDRAGEVIALGDRPLRIGRKPQNDLALADEKASGVHAEVVFEGDRFVLRDLGSTNGTLMDGRKVTEVVLGPGDTFAIGRVRMRFRGEDDAAAPGEGFAVERIDAARLQAARRSSRSTGVLVLLLVAAVGAGGYLLWRGRTAAGGEGGEAARGPRAELQVAGNRLPQETANCDGENGWDLRVAGAGFHGGAAAHSGTAALAAQRADGETTDFAVAATTTELRLLAGRTLTAVAHLRCEGQARVGLRLTFWSSVEGSPFRFCTGTPLAARSGWERVEVAAAVPVGADRCRLEVAALLPDAASAAMVDDVAVLEAGQAAPIEHKVGDAATVIGTGAALAVRSMDPIEPATLLALSPAAVPAEFQGLLRADLMALSDLGASVTFEGDERSVAFQLAGVDRAELVFPVDSAGGLLVAAEAGFVGVEAASTFAAKDVLLGGTSTRCMLSLPASSELIGRVQGSTYRLTVPAAFRLLVGFRPERNGARELLRRAEAAAQEGRPGAAFDLVRELLRTVPHDAETLAQALGRRAEWHEGMAARLRQLEKDLDEAMFFDTRGGFERVVHGLDELVATYGEQNVDDPTAIAAMRARAAGRFGELDAARRQEQQQRRENLALAFEQAGFASLAALVRKE